MGGGIFSIFRKVLNPLNWKCMKKLLLSVVAAFCITASPAQSFEELLAPVHSCCERGNRAMEAKRYAEAEREYREAIRLFEYYFRYNKSLWKIMLSINDKYYLFFIKLTVIFAAY